MPLKTYTDLVQGTQEWLDARCGIITASVVGKLITPSTLKPASNDTARGVMKTSSPSASPTMWSQSARPLTWSEALLTSQSHAAFTPSITHQCRRSASWSATNGEQNRVLT